MADYQCNFNFDDCIKKLGLEERGKVQKAVTDTFKMQVEPFMPFDEGRLIESGHIENETDIVWDTENKARRLYYGDKSWNWSNGGVQNGGLRGPYWADRYMQNGGRQEIEKAAREAVKK